MEKSYQGPSTGYIIILIIMVSSWKWGGPDWITYVFCSSLEDVIFVTFNLFSKGVWKFFGAIYQLRQNHFMLHSNAYYITRDTIKTLTEFRQKHDPLTYLEYPIFVCRPRNIYFCYIVNKVVWMITRCPTKILNYGFLAVLTKHVLLALLIHLLSVITPPSSVLKRCQWLFADFCRGWKNNMKRYHWASGKNLTLQYDEGGVGMRNLKDFCLAFQYKQRSVFRTKKTIWGKLLRAKYF